MSPVPAQEKAPEIGKDAAKNESAINGATTLDALNGLAQQVINIFPNATERQQYVEQFQKRAAELRNQLRETFSIDQNLENLQKRYEYLQKRFQALSSIGVDLNTLAGGIGIASGLGALTGGMDAAVKAAEKLSPALGNIASSIRDVLKAVFSGMKGMFTKNSIGSWFRSWFGNKVAALPGGKEIQRALDEESEMNRVELFVDTILAGKGITLIFPQKGNPAFRGIFLRRLRSMQPTPAPAAAPVAPGQTPAPATPPSRFSPLAPENMALTQAERLAHEFVDKVKKGIPEDPKLILTAHMEDIFDPDAYVKKQLERLKKKES